jgi:hypothetical protein
LYRISLKEYEDVRGLYIRIASRAASTSAHLDALHAPMRRTTTSVLLARHDAGRAITIHTAV